MGCGHSKHKRNAKKLHEPVEQQANQEANTQQVLNSWEPTPPAKTLYPQGKTDVNKILETEVSGQGTVYEPNPEIMAENVEGELVPAENFYSIVPVEAITPMSKSVVNNKNLLDWSDVKENEIVCQEKTDKNNQALNGINRRQNNAVVAV